MFGFLPGHTACCAKAAQCYRAHFCGLCNVLRQEYGLWARWLINRDSTFLSLLGNALQSEAPVETVTTCCNPWATPRPLYQSGSITPYVAAVTISGLVAKVDDDRQDERGLRRLTMRIGGKLLGESESKAVGFLHSMGFPVAQIRKSLSDQTEHGVEALHATGNVYGSITGFLHSLTNGKNSSHTQTALQKIGYELGFLIHLQGALDDWSKDQKRSRNNPLSHLPDYQQRHHFAHTVGVRSLDHLKDAFNQLPLVRNRDLLHGVLINGVQQRVERMALPMPMNWDDYERNQSRKPPQTEENSNDKDSWWKQCDCSCCNCTDCGDCCLCRPKESGSCDCPSCDMDCCGCDCSCN